VKINDYLCTCYGNNYNGMPIIEIESNSNSKDKEKRTVFTQDPGNYMYLPFMNFEKSMQQCILALAPPKTFSNLPGEHDGDEPNALILGQRFLSKYKFIAIVDRNTNTIATAI
jgi:hypothetical protein